MHSLTGAELARDEGYALPFRRHDEDQDRALARWAVGVSAAGLSATGAIELVLALLTGSVGLLGDALHNLSDVSTSAVVLFGFRVSRRSPSASHPYGYERAEDLAGLGVALVVWASAVFAGLESWRKLAHHGATAHIGWGMVGTVVGMLGNQAVARYKMTVGRRIQSTTLVAEAHHSWLDALSSLGVLGGLVFVALGHPIGDPIAGFAVTLFICRVGYEVTKDLLGHLMDAVDPEIVRSAESASESIPGVSHAHARARWTGRSLVVEVEGWLSPSMSMKASDEIGVAVAKAVAGMLPEVRGNTWRARPYMTGPIPGSASED